MSSESVIVNISSDAPDWNRLAYRCRPGQFRWKSYSGKSHSEHPRPAPERRITRPRPGHYRAVMAGVSAARREDAALLVTHGPRITAAAGALYRKMGLRMPHLSVGFTMTGLPGGARRACIARAIRQVDRFVCFSGIERDRYARVFDIPPEKIDIRRWSVAEPPYDAATPPIVGGDYLCAIGSEGRDVATLLAAMERVPDLRLVLVTRPANLEGLRVPANVDVRTDIPIDQVWNITHNARLHALPLVSNDVPAGHGTLIMAMQLSTPSVVTRSDAMTDYVRDNETALECTPRDPGSLAERIRELWDDRALAGRLTDAGRRFALEECSEDLAYAYFQTYLQEHGLLPARADF